MAVLAELLLVLAGFDSGLDAWEFQHPAESDIFERALAFGQRFAVLRDACALRSDAVATAIEIHVVQKYLTELADIETEVLATLSQETDLPLGDGLFKSAEIMSRAVDQWQLRFEMSLRLLTELDPNAALVAQNIEEVYSAARLHAGFDDVAKLCMRCVEGLDTQWLGQLKDLLTTLGSEYHSDAADIGAHPSLVGTAGPTLLANAFVSIHQLSARHVNRVRGLLVEFLDVADANASLIDSVEVPISSRQLLPVLEQIHANILKLVRKHTLHTRDVEAMLTFLRDIFLFGSSVFIDHFSISNGDAELALDRLCETDQIFATEIYALVEPVVTFAGGSSELHVQWPLSLIFTTDHCAVYRSLHTTFAALVLTMETIRPGEGAAMHTYRLFLAMLWSEFQAAVDSAFDELRRAINIDTDVSVQSKQSRILRDLVKKLFLDSPSIRTQLQSVIDHADARSSNVKPVQDLATALSQLSSGRNLPLQPFIDAQLG